jgi:hypothetical protein
MRSPSYQIQQMHNDDEWMTNEWRKMMVMMIPIHKVMSVLNNKSMIWKKLSWCTSMIIFPLQRCPPSFPPMKLLNTTNTYWWMDDEWMRKNDDDDFHTQSYVCVVWAKAQFKRSFHDAHPGISFLFKRYPSSPLTLLDQYYNST